MEKAKQGRKALGENQQQQQQQHEEEEEEEEEEEKGGDNEGIRVSSRVKGGRKGGRKGKRKGRVAISTEALTKSFGWSVQDAFTQHDVQVGREGGREGGRAGMGEERRKEVVEREGGKEGGRAGRSTHVFTSCLDDRSCAACCWRHWSGC